MSENEVLSGLQRLKGVFISPGETFAHIARNPSWFLPLLLISSINLIFILTVLPILSNETLTTQREKLSVKGMEQTEIEETLDITKNVIPYVAPPSSVIVPIVILVLVAGIFLFVGNVVLGGSSRFRNVFAITVYAWLVVSLGTMIELPLVLTQKTMKVSFSLAVLIPPGLSETFVYYLLSKTSIFMLLWVALQSIGLAVLYKINTKKMALYVSAIYSVYAIASSTISSVF